MPRQRFRILLAAAAAALLCGRSLLADDPPRGDTRDVILMLKSGPIHVRLHLTLGGRPLSVVREEYLDRLMQDLDVDQDGVVSQQERLRSPLYTYNRRREAIDNPLLQSLRSERQVTRTDLQHDMARVGGGTVVSYRQDDSAAENDLLVFELLDSDESGRIDPGEMRTAAARVAALDEDRDECISFAEFNTEEEVVDPQLAVVGFPLEEPDRPRPSASDLLRDFKDRTLTLRIVQRYDRNRDRKLTAEEIGWDAERLGRLDENGDGFLDHRELSRLDEAAPDLELAVDVLGAEDAASLEVVSSAADRRAPAPRPDLVRLSFGSITVTFSYRQIDPLQRAVDSAIVVFNQVDQDGNGYVDRDEIQGDDRYRWGRYLFDDMDRDGDEKVFAEEVQDYVSVVCEPASTTCQVNLYDTGQGFFQMMDSSGDGRISVRELRTLEEALREYADGPDGSIEPGESGRHYHVEFVRGSFQIFGESQRMVVQGPTFIERPAVGPIWFQRMDRNSDGDLTYDSRTSYGGEFLGPREAFHLLDADGDGLVDAQEAERASELWPETFGDADDTETTRLDDGEAGSQ